VVIEEYDAERPRAMTRGPHIVLLSAKDEARLKERAQRLLGAIRRAGPGSLAEHDLADIAYTLQVGRESMEERLALIVNSLEELERKLDAFVAGGGDPARVDDLVRGQVRRGRNTLATLTVDEELQRAVEGWIRKRQYSRLLELWVNGLSID
jgi:polyketide synthase PksN